MLNSKGAEAVTDGGFVACGGSIYVRG